MGRSASTVVGGRGGGLWLKGLTNHGNGAGMVGPGEAWMGLMTPHWTGTPVVGRTNRSVGGGDYL